MEKRNDSQSSLKAAASPDRLASLTHEQIVERKRRMLNAFDRAFGAGVQELNDLKAQREPGNGSELEQQVKQLPPERQVMGAPAFKVLKYWRENCPNFLARLGNDARNAAILRQNLYLDRFDELIEENADPLTAHQTADRETIYLPSAEVDHDWIR